ncbi:MAG: hypothetical protein U5M23_13200 [Marinagarivorans sp.]|nr:hypothetical protein [Marinagarivorans sp.]
MLFRVGIQTAALLLLTNILSVENFALLIAAAGLGIIFGSLSTMGTHIALLAKIAKNSESLTDISAIALPITLITGAALSAAWLGLFSFVHLSADVHLTSLFLIALSEIVIQPLIVLASNELIAKGKTAFSQTITIVPLVIRILGMAIMLCIDAKDLNIICYIWIISTAIILPYLIFTKIVIWHPPTDWRIPKKSELKELAGFACINFTQMTALELDKPLSVKLLPAEMAGIYTLCSRIIYAAIQPISALIFSALPKLYQNNSLEKSKQISQLILLFSFGYGAVICFLLREIGPYITYVIPATYADISLYLYTICLALPFMAVRISSINIIMASSSPWVRVRCESFAIITCLIFCTIGALVNGLAGYIYGYIAYEIVTAIFNTGFILKNSGRIFKV